MGIIIPMERIVKKLRNGEFISREAAIKAIRNDVMGGLNAEFIVNKLPAADVRPVVLCRDCQDSYKWENAHGDSYRYCGYLRSRWNHDTDRMVDDDDYCKWGVKREES